MFEELEKHIGLHESIEIYYIVDGYEAIFLTIDGRKESNNAHG